VSSRKKFFSSSFSIPTPLITVFFVLSCWCIGLGLRGLTVNYISLFDKCFDWFPLFFMGLILCLTIGYKVAKKLEK